MPRNRFALSLFVFLAILALTAVWLSGVPGISTRELAGALAAALAASMAGRILGRDEERLSGAERRALDHRIAFEDLVVRISAKFVSLKPGEVDAGINDALADIGRFAGVDRSYVFQFSEDMRFESCTHEWCAPGVDPAIDRLQKLSLDNYPWFMERIGKGRVLHVPDVSSLPPEAAAERAEFEAERIRSIIMVPLFFEGVATGYMGFDAVRQSVEWSPEIVVLLSIVGEIVFSALHRKRTELALHEQTLALEKANLALVKSNEELKQFAYVASHDLQEPLRAVAGFSSLLKRDFEGRLGPTADDYLEYITAAASRMHAMILDLLEYSRVDSKAMPFVETDTADTLKTAIANLTTSISESGADIRHGMLPTVVADPSQLVQLFQNLIANAIKFRSNATPAIRIEAKQVGDEWQFSIADNGIGFDKQYQDRIFQIFRRLHTSDRFPGTGIGLSVCKRIVERHHGRIWVESAPGRGSTFYFTLLAHAAGSQPPGARAQA